MDSNHQPPAYQASALTSCATSRNRVANRIWTDTPWVQIKHTTKLYYTDFCGLERIRTNDLLCVKEFCYTTNWANNRNRTDAPWLEIRHSTSWAIFAIEDVEGFEPPNKRFAIFSLKPLGYTSILEEWGIEPLELSLCAHFAGEATADQNLFFLHFFQRTWG